MYRIQRKIYNWTDKFTTKACRYARYFKLSRRSSIPRFFIRLSGMHLASDVRLNRFGILRTISWRSVINTQRYGIRNVREVKVTTYRFIIRVWRSGTDWTGRIFQNVVLFYATGLGNHLSGCREIRIFAEISITLHAATMELKTFVPMSYTL